MIKKFVGLYLSLLLLVMLSVVIYSYQEPLTRVFSKAYGVAGLFLLSFISCVSIIPIPYIVIVFKLAPYVNPLTTSIVVGLASALGEAVAWSLGRASSRALSGTIYMKRVNALLRFAERKGRLALPFLAFIFSLTFLPDKVLYLPLGIMRYSLWRLLPFTAFGKILMTYLVLRLGRYWYEVVGYEGNSTSFIITTAVLALIMVLMVVIDWEKILRDKL